MKTNIGQEPIFGVSDFVAALNQTLEFTYPSAVIVGELANFRVSKNKWVYFDLKDEESSLKFFGSVYNLSGPLEDGIVVQVRAHPRLHNQFGFSMNFQTIMPVGEGSLKRAAALLEAKLKAEGLFDLRRKRTLPYPPGRIGLITSGESAAYHDFLKILNERWRGIEIDFYDVQVQGEQAPAQITRAIEHFNEADTIDVLIITRGGGSAEDLAAFNSEPVTRAVAASRTPTLVAIGHEIDISLAELAADQRASTPTNAAQVLTPDRREEKAVLDNAQGQLSQLLSQAITSIRQTVKSAAAELGMAMNRLLAAHSEKLNSKANLLLALNPSAVLRRGYAVVRANGRVLKNAKNIRMGQEIAVELGVGSLTADVKKVNLSSEYDS